MQCYWIIYKEGTLIREYISPNFDRSSRENAPNEEKLKIHTDKAAKIDKKMSPIALGAIVFRLSEK